MRSVALIQSVQRTWFFSKQRVLSFFMSNDNDVQFQTQLTLTIERKRERFSYFFRVRAERKKMSGLKGLNTFHITSYSDI